MAAEALRRSARVSAHAEGRPEADWRRVRAAHRGARRGDASAAHAQPRHAAGDRSVTISGPYNVTGAGDSPSRRRIFVCRPAVRGRGAAVRAPDPLDARAPRVPPPGRPRRTCRDLLPFYERGAQRGQLRSRHPEGARAAARQLAVPLPHRARAGERRRRHARIASATSSSRRGCRSSSGAAFRTTSCSTRRPRDG